MAGVEASDEAIREAGELNAADGGLDVVVNAAELDGGGVELGDVVDDVAGLGMVRETESRKKMQGTWVWPWKQT